MEKLVQRHRTRQTNLKAKRDELVAVHEGLVETIDTELADIKEILGKLEA